MKESGGPPYNSSKNSNKMKHICYLLQINTILCKYITFLQCKSE